MQADIEAIYTGVMDFISEAIKAADPELMEDMKPLNTKVAALMGAINALPIEKRVEYRHELNVLFENLTTLENRLKSRRNAITEELGSQVNQRKAHAAYSKTDVMGGA